MLTLLAQSAVDILDEVVGLFDQAVSARESHAKAKSDQALTERAKQDEARQLLLEVILPVRPTRRSRTSRLALCCGRRSA